jgi:putative hydrolase of the HAD superfamily
VLAARRPAPARASSPPDSVRPLPLLEPLASERPIDAVLFDFGGVLTIGSPFTALGALGLDAGVDPERVLEVLMGVYHEDTDHPFHRMERGELGAAEWFALAQTDLAGIGITVEPGALIALFQSLGVQEAMVDRVRALKSDGYRTAIVTNNVREAADGWRAMLPVDELFDVVVDSSAVGMRKPDPRIYRLALAELGDVAPDRAVFLDDHPGNVAAARRLGMHAILVTETVENALDELDRILGGNAT